MQLTKVGKRQLAQHQQRFFPKTAGKRALSRGFIQSRSCLNVTIGGTGSSTKRISMRHCQHNERTAHKGRGKRGPTPATLGTQSVPVAQSQKRKNQQFPWLGPKTSNKHRPKLFSHFSGARSRNSPTRTAEGFFAVRSGSLPETRVDEEDEGLLVLWRSGGGTAANRNLAKTKGPGFDLRAVNVVHLCRRMPMITSENNRARAVGEITASGRIATLDPADEG